MCDCVNRNLIVIGWKIIGKTDATHMRIASRFMCTHCSTIYTIEDIEAVHNAAWGSMTENNSRSAATSASLVSANHPVSSQSTF